MAIVDETLEKIGAKQKRLFVFNKIDACPPERVMELKMAAATGFSSLVTQDFKSKRQSVENASENAEFVPKTIQGLPDPEFVSAFSGEGLERLKKRILEELKNPTA